MRVQDEMLSGELPPSSSICRTFFIDLRDVAPILYPPFRNPVTYVFVHLIWDVTVLDDVIAREEGA